MNLLQNLLVILCALALLISDDAVHGEDATELDPRLPSQAKLGSPVTYDVDFSVVVTAPYGTKKLAVWLPLPPSDETQQIDGRELTSFPVKVEPEVNAEPVYGNEFAYFEFDRPKGAQIIRHRFRATVHELRWNVDPATIDQIAKWPASFDPYFKRRQLFQSEGLLGASLRELMGGSTRPDIFSVMNWVDKNLAYDHSTASLRADPLFALRERRGHCSDYHGLCAAMGQALGYPTRVAYGVNLFPKNSPSHCKLEAFLPPHGWVSFDVSETQKMVKEIDDDPQLDTAGKERLSRLARQRFQRGFRDNTWLLVTRGTDYELAPPASKPVPVVRTIYAEADGMPLPDPDPANPDKREFAWMTAHRFQADRNVPYPFKDRTTLEEMENAK